MLYCSFQELKRTGHLSPKVSFTLDKNTMNSISVHSDYTRMRQIIENLLKNAFKFTHVGEIHLGQFISDNMLNIYVSDTGLGIHPDKFSIIFEPFRQIEDSNSRNFGGTGMGLTICKKLVEKLGGFINFESTLHKGSTFTVKLPKESVQSHS